MKCVRKPKEQTTFYRYMVIHVGLYCIELHDFYIGLKLYNNMDYEPYVAIIVSFLYSETETNCVGLARAQTVSLL